jgi:IclR family transcriptional regulator, mhp operon transcriptional activator
MSASNTSNTSTHGNQKNQLMRGPLRTIAVLRALNLRNGASVAELSKSTGRPALYRILETLRDAGYVSVDLRRQHYCLTMLVRTLAEGFSDEDWVIQVARPVLRTLQREVLWPVDLGTFMNNYMWIRETTRQSSPLTVDRGVVGVRFPMLRGATGKAYLAFCPAAERKQILRNIVRSAEPDSELIAKPAHVAAELGRTRRLGYGQRYGDPPLDTGAIAVPILLRGRVLGCINLTFVASALRPEEAARQHLRAMNNAATQIAEAMQRFEKEPKEKQPK